MPVRVKFDEHSDRKLSKMERGDQKNFIQTPDIVDKIINKEDIYPLFVVTFVGVFLGC